MIKTILDWFFGGENVNYVMAKCACTSLVAGFLSVYLLIGLIVTFIWWGSVPWIWDIGEWWGIGRILYVVPAIGVSILSMFGLLAYYEYYKENKDET